MNERLQFDSQDDGEPPSSYKHVKTPISFDIDDIKDRRPWSIQEVSNDEAFEYMDFLARFTRRQTWEDLQADTAAIARIEQEKEYLNSGEIPVVSEYRSRGIGGWLLSRLRRSNNLENA